MKRIISIGVNLSAIAVIVMSAIHFLTDINIPLVLQQLLLTLLIASLAYNRFQLKGKPDGIFWLSVIAGVFTAIVAVLVLLF